MIPTESIIIRYMYLSLATSSGLVGRDLRHVPLVSFFVYSVTLDHASGINNDRKEMLFVFGSDKIQSK